MKKLLTSGTLRNRVARLRLSKYTQTILNLAPQHVCYLTITKGAKWYFEDGHGRHLRDVTAEDMRVIKRPQEVTTCAK